MFLSTSTLRRRTALLMACGLAFLASSGTLLAAQSGTLTGRVLAANGATPRSGVTVTLVDPASEQIYKSSPTDARGAFAISSAPAGSYALLVETQEGAFLASDNLQLAPGVNRPVSLALKPGKQGDAPAATPAPAKKSSVPTWAKWVIAGGIVIGAAIVVDAVTSNPSEASGF